MDDIVIVGTRKLVQKIIWGRVHKVSARVLGTHLVRKNVQASCLRSTGRPVERPRWSGGGLVGSSGRLSFIIMGNYVMRTETSVNHAGYYDG